MTMELRVGNKYRLGRKIGSGSFGDIYLGKFPLLLFFFSPCMCQISLTLPLPFTFRHQHCYWRRSCH